MPKKSSLLVYTEELFLLSDLLSQNCAFADIDFQALCNRSEHIYGPPSKSGQGKHRLFQKRFHQIQIWTAFLTLTISATWLQIIINDWPIWK